MFFDSEDSDVYSSGSEPGTYDDNLIQAEGIHATIYRVGPDDADDFSPNQANVPEIRAVKSVTAFKNARLEPHDIRTEACALARLCHIHIIQLLGASYQQKLFRLTMPFVPLTLQDLLDNPKCSPYLPPIGPMPKQALRTNSNTLDRFSALSKSFLYQITTAVAFLHNHTQPIAHRDLKPSNVLVRPEDGCIKLCDFGISWDGRPRGHGASPEEIEREPRGDDGNGRLNVHGFFDADVPRPEWEESSERMCCQISSGPYRAPELLFAPRQYDAYATDLWSLGVLASNFFTSLRFDPDSKEVLSRLDDFDWDALIPEKDQEQEEDEHAVSESDPNIPFNLPAASSGTEKGTWSRMHLFDSTRGEIGLVASIFKLLGTPTEETWPGFNSLPAASALVFNPVSPRPLESLLPHLVDKGLSAATGDSSVIGPTDPASIRAIADCPTRDSENVVELIQALVRYPPQSRTSASDLLRHAYFTQGHPLFLPPASGDAESSGQSPWLHRGWGESNTLAELISQMLTPETGQVSDSS